MIDAVTSAARDEEDQQSAKDAQVFGRKDILHELLCLRILPIPMRRNRRDDDVDESQESCITDCEAQRQSYPDHPFDGDRQGAHETWVRIAKVRQVTRIW